METEQYIVTYLFPQMGNEELTTAHSELVRVLEDNKARVVQSRMPVMRQLAFAIKKHKSAFMGEIEFWAEPSVISTIKVALKQNEVLLRYLITKKVAVSQRSIQKTRRKVAEKDQGKEEESLKEKISIEDIDKRLEEIIDNVGDA